MNEILSPIWRPMTADDIPAVLDIETLVHVEYHEGEQMFANRFSLFPEGCFVCKIGEDIVGYMLSHPWQLGSPVALNMMLETIPPSADCLYIHDFVLLPAARGSGAAQMALDLADGLAVKLGLNGLAIVAIPDAVGFWEHVGFLASPTHIKDIERKYGAGARYMERLL